ncbi:hypothetical protein ACH4LN_32135 [Streptomyces albus]|uniref:hypothetical protein n=1 Tax=Streptomyces TaxID=1883 RepID=UPI000B17D2F3|nr:MULTISPECIES: hypothetical protein [Streptomyces]QID39797.1 hypothetical protein G3260_006740 [Streptomyces albus]UVN53091.1 hypothetical protein NR995_00190 [Streptomyces albus]GHJ19087.1 hypothetical protein TPA0909_07010 [Streptomyces albus]
MTPEYCPHRRVEDTCPGIARMLAEAGLLTPAPDAPASAGPVIDIPSVPPPR